MDKFMMNVGLGALVDVGRIISIVEPGTRPVTRIVKAASERGRLMDYTVGRKTRSVIVLRGMYVVLSPNSPQTHMDRIERIRKESRRDSRNITDG